MDAEHWIESASSVDIGSNSTESIEAQSSAAQEIFPASEAWLNTMSDKELWAELVRRSISWKSRITILKSAHLVETPLGDTL